MSSKNKSTSSISSETHKGMALLALALDVAYPTGDKPTLQEIDLWRCHKLSKKRAAEVKAFVARDSDCYQMWSDLLASEQIIKQQSLTKPPTRLRQKLRECFKNQANLWLGGGFAAVAASLFVGVIVIKTLLLPPQVIDGINDDYTTFTGQPLVSGWDYYTDSEKSLNFNPPSAYDLQKPAILVGIYQGLKQLQTAGKLSDKTQWQAIIDSYPMTYPSCAQADNIQNCAHQNQYLANVGRWLAILQLSCAQTAQQTPEFYSLQEQRLVYFIKQSETYPTLSPLHEQLQNWQTPLTQQHLCKHVGNLLASIDE